MKKIWDYTEEDLRNLVPMELPRVGYEFNINNYKEYKGIKQAAQLLALGGMVLSLDGNVFTVHDEDFIKHHVAHYWLKLRQAGVKPSINFSRTLRKYFVRPSDVVWYLQGSAALDNKFKWVMSALDGVEEYLASKMADYIATAREQEAKVEIERLREVYKELGLTKEEYESAPVQVTTHLSPSIREQKRFMEGQAPYWVYEDSYNLMVRAHHEVEAKIVNAWLSRLPEFNTPTKEEQAQELESLREWFQELKATRKERRVTPEEVDKYVRLQELEDAVSYYLNPEWVSK